VGSLSSQVKPRREATSPKTVPGIVHLSAKNAREPKVHLGAKKNASEAISNHYELIFILKDTTLILIRKAKVTPVV
jgi:hypothetical protein